MTGPHIQESGSRCPLSVEEQCGVCFPLRLPLIRTCMLGRGEFGKRISKRLGESQDKGRDSLVILSLSGFPHHFLSH